MQEGIATALPVVACVIAFLTGSIPLKKTGFANFLMGTAKGVVPVLLVTPYSSRSWSNVAAVSDFEFSLFAQWSVGLFAMLGHCLAPWKRSGDGSSPGQNEEKGVFPGFGVMLVLSPIGALAGAAGYGLTFFTKGNSALARIAGVISAFVAHLVFVPLGTYAVPLTIMLFVILIRHESDMDELLKDSLSDEN